jgi:hydroxyversicolorone monooxygenase
MAFDQSFSISVARVKQHPGFVPDFPVNCRRITPGDAYMAAIQEPNVDIHFTGVIEIHETGVTGADGIFRECDIVVCATGFDTSYVPRFAVIGRDGVDLRERWKDKPEAYFGLACPEMPNWLTFMGPNWLLS